MADHEAQPAKKQCVDAGDSLLLPAGAVVPLFYTEERDACMVSTALQLGADAVYYLRNKATEDRLKELSEQKVSELVETIAKLEAKLSVVREEATKEVERRVEVLRLVMEQEVELRDKYNKEKAAALQKFCEELEQQCSSSLADLESQRKVTSQLDAAAQTVRKNEREKAKHDIQNTLGVLNSQAVYLNGLLKSLEEDGVTRQALFKQVFELARERQQTVEKRALAAHLSIHIKGAVGEFNLCALIKNAFGMVEDFRLRDTTRTKTGKTGDFIAQIWGLQTLWDCKNYSTKVDTTQIEKIKRDLKHNPDVDVGFLVSMTTSIIGHEGRIFDLEIVSPRQTLVYVNELMNNDDPIDLLRVFARPLFKALRHAKQAYADGRTFDADSWDRFVTQWTGKVSTQIKDLQTERREFREEKQQSEERFNGREKLIAMREAALKALLNEMGAPR